MKKALVFISVMICAFLALGVNAFADMGPKPSVTVYVNGVEDDREYYIALIEEIQASRYNSTNTEGRDEVWNKIQEFSKTDGYCIADSPVSNPYNKLKGKDSARWGYYPPETFKILLCFPDNESFLVSGVQNKYSFVSYFTVDVKGDRLTVSQNGGALGIAVEIGGLLIRIAVTVLIEVAIAYGFGYRGKPELRLILITNIVTQVLLNALIAFGDYGLGGLGAALALIVGEMFVFFVETVLYAVALPNLTEIKTGGGRAVGYAFTANFASLVGGGIWMLCTELVLDVIIKRSIL